MAGCNAFQQGNTYYIMVRQGRRAYKQTGLLPAPALAAGPRSFCLHEKSRFSRREKYVGHNSKYV